MKPGRGVVPVKRYYFTFAAAALLAAVMLTTQLLTGCARKAGPDMWFDHSTKKILKNDTGADGMQNYTLYLARNESEGCQVAVRYSGFHEHFTLEVAPEAPAAGLTVSVFREHYVPVIMSQPFLNVSGADEGRYDEYPDALSPLSGEVYVDAGITTPFYILVNAAKDALPGEYRFTVTAKDSGEVLSAATFTVHVWAFVLPDAPAMAAVSDLSASCIAQQTGAKDDELLELYIKYYEFMLDHHVSPYSLPFDVLDDRADKYMSDPRVTGFRVGYGSDEYLAAVAEKLRSNPDWLRKAYFYFLDEPSDQDSYMTLVSKSEHLLSIFPEARIVSPFFVDPEMYTGTDAVEYCFGTVNIWCAKLFCFDSANIYSPSLRQKLAPLSDRLKARRALGEDVWTYVCWEPGEPYLNLYVNMEGVQHRLIFWQNYMLGANGFLYWSSNYWSRIKDPWTDMATVNWLSSYVFGDGSLIYNGNKVGVDGACSSLRLELVRDGVDDYTYLALLEAAGVPYDEVLKYVNSVTTTLTDYTLSGDRLYRARAALGTRLEQLAGRDAN